jgi:hypothetical protein
MSYLKKIFKSKKKVVEYTQNDWLRELDWANVYHDSIRGRPYLEDLPLNVGRWAGNYAFFYVLNRIMHDYKPKKIIEFGLGESTKFVASCIEGLKYECDYLIIEQNEDWKSIFEANNKLLANSNILHCPLISSTINGFNVNSYKDLKSKINYNADFYIIDGPFGSDRFSRYDIYYLAEELDAKSEFIILIDDCQRVGEQDTFNALQNLFKQKKINYYVAEYGGVKTFKLLVSSKYRYSTTF